MVAGIDWSFHTFHCYCHQCDLLPKCTFHFCPEKPLCENLNYSLYIAVIFMSSRREMFNSIAKVSAQKLFNLQVIETHTQIGVKFPMQIVKGSFQKLTKGVRIFNLVKSQVTAIFALTCKLSKKCSFETTLKRQLQAA